MTAQLVIIILKPKTISSVYFLRASLGRRFLKLAPYFIPTWFLDALFTIFGYPYFFSNTKWNMFFCFLISARCDKFPKTSTILSSLNISEECRSRLYVCPLYYSNMAITAATRLLLGVSFRANTGNSPSRCHA